MNKYRFLVYIICFLLIVSAFCSCKKSSEIHDKSYFEYFDTVSTVYSYAGDSREDFLSNCREVEKILEKYHRLFDIYNEYEGINNLCTVNKNAGKEAIVVDKELIDFLLYAKEIYYLTGGETNVMLGSVLSLWHDCRTEAEIALENAALPDTDLLVRATMHTSIELLKIDEKNSTVFIVDSEASIDVGAIGKGYATEKAAEYLKTQGVSGYVLDIGGNIRIVGSKPDGSGWVTGIRDPKDTEKYARKLTLSDISCVTSGDYERYFEIDGKRYHHIIDKDTGMPAEYFSSVTVICEDSALADALSTALFCMSYDDGLSVVKNLEGIDVIWILPNGEILETIDYEGGS